LQAGVAGRGPLRPKARRRKRRCRCACLSHPGPRHHANEQARRVHGSITRNYVDEPGAICPDSDFFTRHDEPTAPECIQDTNPKFPCARAFSNEISPRTVRARR
jgi:hypothetical protein